MKIFHSESHWVSTLSKYFGMNDFLVKLPKKYNCSDLLPFAVTFRFVEKEDKLAAISKTLTYRVSPHRTGHTFYSDKEVTIDFNARINPKYLKVLLPEQGILPIYLPYCDIILYMIHISS